MPFAISFLRLKPQPCHTEEELACTICVPPGFCTVHSKSPWQKANRFFIEQRDMEIVVGEIPFEAGVGGEVDP